MSEDKLRAHQLPNSAKFNFKTIKNFDSALNLQTGT